jgi:N-formylglutamate amidohydrolase
VAVAIIESELFEERPPTAPAVPLIVSIPHAGTEVPPGVAARFASPDIAALPMTDWHLPDLYDFVPALGATLLAARYSRFVVDLNRPPDGRPLYPGRFETGLVPLTTFDGDPVFGQPPSAAETDELAAAYHRPYHDRLRTLLEATRSRFGRAVLIDAHSVASGPSEVHGALEEEVYLGDRDGRTCGTWLRDLLLAGFRESGWRVVHNQIYKGGYTTAHYGEMDGVDAIQIEMCQRTYMDESQPSGAPERRLFARARERLRPIVAAVAGRLRESAAGD